MLLFIDIMIKALVLLASQQRQIILFLSIQINSIAHIHGQMLIKVEQL